MTSFSAYTKRFKPVQTGLAAVLLSSFAMFQNAFAVGTAAGTDITNTATVSYTVGTVAQTPVTSNISTFKVDHKVDLTVNNGVPTSTAPGANNVGVVYTVVNTGNGADNFTFQSVIQGGTFSATNLRVYRDSTTTGPLAGVFDGTDTLIPAGTPVAFTADQSINFLIVSDIPLTATNGQSSSVRLVATTTSTATVGADNPAAVDVVFADAGNNGTEFDDNQYDISAATLSVVKSAAVITDPVNLTGPNRKAIPGATIEYSIVVTNSGAANATAVALSDNIPANTTYVPASMTLNAGALTDAALDDAGTFTGTAVNVSAGTVTSAGGTATVTFRVIINN
jgi:uncharacterized repeat protein (TIGR01451 family)